MKNLSLLSIFCAAIAFSLSSPAADQQSGFNLGSSGICTNQLQEEANVFEVQCMFWEYNICYITGYFTHPMLKPGYNGIVARLLPASFAKPEEKNGSLVITTLRRSEPRVPTPVGYFRALEAASRVMLREDIEVTSDFYPLRSGGPIYFDAVTGRRAPPPDIQCLPPRGS